MGLEIGLKHSIRWPQKSSGFNQKKKKTIVSESFADYHRRLQIWGESNGEILLIYSLEMSRENA